MLLFSVQVFKAFNFMVIPCYKNTKHAKFTIYRILFQFKFFSFPLIGKTEVSFPSLSTNNQLILLNHNHLARASIQILYLKFRAKYKLKIGGKVLVAQSCLILCNPTNCSPLDSSVHGIIQARILEWVTIPSLEDFPNPGIKPRSPALRQILYHLSHHNRYQLI